jgi:hypothetical protein
LEDRSEAPGFILIVKQDNRNYAKITLARVALRDFTLQILHEAVREVILSALAASIFLIAVAAVRTMKFYRVQLRIAVQSCPAGAAHPDSLGIMPFHGKPSDDRSAAIRELDPRPQGNKMHWGPKTLQKILYYTEKTVLSAHPTGEGQFDWKSG